MHKKIYIIAGPNGSGKTTFATKFLPDYANCRNFINADLIAQGLSPFSPRIAALRAGRLVLERIHDLSDKGVDFSFETTLSGKSYSTFLQHAKKKGYEIDLFFLWVPNPQLALARIKDRVAEGGHDVPAVDVVRRFYRGITNLFALYRPLLDSWTLFNNAGAAPRLIAQEHHRKIVIFDQDLFDVIRKDARIDI